MNVEVDHYRESSKIWDYITIVKKAKVLTTKSKGEFSGIICSMTDERTTLKSGMAISIFANEYGAQAVISKSFAYAFPKKVEGGYQDRETIILPVTGAVSFDTDIITGLEGAFELKFLGRKYVFHLNGYNYDTFTPQVMLDRFTDETSDYNDKRKVIPMSCRRTIFQNKDNFEHPRFAVYKTGPSEKTKIKLLKKLKRWLDKKMTYRFF